MKDYGFKIKVSDLLLNPGKKDFLEFENKFTKQLEKLTEKGINGKIKLQSLDENTILVNIEDLETQVNEVCEKCGAEFVRNIKIDNVEAKFMHKKFLTNPDEKIHDDEFEINGKDQTIDLEDFVVQSILNENPTVIKCDICENLILETDEDDENGEELNDEDEIVENKINWL